jgi:hypothetical protein
MSNERSLEEIRKKAHSINCALFEEGYSPREIEIVGYYLKRIAASYLSYFTHKEYERTLNKEMVLEEDAKEEYKHM